MIFPILAMRVKSKEPSPSTNSASLPLKTKTKEICGPLKRYYFIQDYANNRAKQSLYWRIQNDRLASGWRRFCGFRRIYQSLQGCISRTFDIHRAWTYKRRSSFTNERLKRKGEGMWMSLHSR